MFSLFKPNKSNSGSMATFNASVDTGNGQNAGKKDELIVWLSVRRQATWDEKSRKGSFHPKENAENSINIKINLSEMGGIRRALLNKDRFSAIHSSPAGTVQLAINYDTKPNPKGGIYEGFYLNIVSNQTNKFNTPISLDEAQALADYLLISQFIYLQSRMSDFLSSNNKGGGQQPTRNQGYNTNQRNAPTNSQPSDSSNLPETDPFASDEGPDSDPFSM